jgi:predicted short-subunit dehydrogenase-like oxidoreductase (DUF2520 family)
VKTVLIGSGNVAWNLAQALNQAKEIEVLLVLGRDGEKLEGFEQWAPTSTDWNDLPEADLYFLAVSDRAISSLSEKAGGNGLWVHCSGSTALDQISAGVRRGVFYPLQTFTKGRQVDFKKIPIGLEAENESDYQLLEGLARQLSPHFFRMNSRQRLKIHLAAVWANNFGNHMVAVAEDIAANADVPREVLYPLIEETIAKAKTLGAHNAQTGPARRDDRETLRKHLDLLDNPGDKELYQRLSQSIKNNYHPED